MSLFSLVKSSLGALLLAVGEFFRWLNRRNERKEKNAVNDRISQQMAAAAKPSPKTAARLNRWLARGRSGRLRNPRR